MPYALCLMPYALCRIVPHLSEKGYSKQDCFFVDFMRVEH